MRVNHGGRISNKKYFLLYLIAFFLVLFVYFIYNKHKTKNGYLVWISDAVLFTELEIKDIKYVDLSNPEWGDWFYVEQDSDIISIYNGVKKNKEPDELFFQKVKINYIDLLYPYYALPTSLEKSYISKIYIFNVDVIYDK